MFEAARRHMRSVATIGVASALTVGGVAMAQAGSDGEVQPAERPMAPAVMGFGMSSLTYGEMHVRNRDGERETIRIDQGKVQSADESSVTIAENDGNEVTIPVDAETEVLAGPAREAALDDLKAGQLVNVTGPKGEPAKAVMVLPKKGDVVRAAIPGDRMPPPPGGGMKFEAVPAP
ncbi:MAG: hypothetical protein M3335_01340 [Actinomycetota bacterium]|nr:hypothetical protein [Actinomycetota bacterium]